MRPMRAALPFLLLLAACAPPAIVPVVQTASVTADAETVAVKSGDDAADDPAIWRNAASTSGAAWEENFSRTAVVMAISIMIHLDVS